MAQMKSRSYSGNISQQDARAQVNAMVKEVVQNFRKLDRASTLTITDLAELFVGNLLKRLGVPIED